jgi:hypothetical protein
MKHPPRNSLLTFGLYLNALLLLGVLLALIGREMPVSLAVPAIGQNIPSADGNGEILVVGGQLSQNAWGLYLVDTGAQTLTVYQFYRSQGDHPLQLRLVAARDIRHDRRLQNFNTLPAPQEVADLVAKEKQSGRVIPEEQAD